MISIPGCAELSTVNTGAIEGLLLRMIRQGLRTFGGSYSWLTAPRAFTVRLQLSLATEHRFSGARSISARTSKDICVARKRVRSTGSSMRPTLERNRTSKQCESRRPFRNNQKKWIYGGGQQSGPRIGGCVNAPSFGRACGIAFLFTNHKQHGKSQRHDQRALPKNPMVDELQTMSSLGRHGPAEGGNQCAESPPYRGFGKVAKSSPGTRIIAKNMPNSRQLARSSFNKD